MNRTHSRPSAPKRSVAMVVAALVGACTTGDADPITSDSGDAVTDTGRLDTGDDVGPERPGCADPGTAGATAGCLRPTHAPEYYVEQALKYFDTLDVSAPEDSVPSYADAVARWEWPPWLKLTALGRDAMNETAAGLRRLDPSTVPERDCRYFEVQPFARCYIVFDYDGQRCPIYEEFTFDDDGRVTFVEAWSDQPALLPQDRDADPWGEDPAYPRLSTRIPGLGTPDAALDLEAAAMEIAAAADPDVADFAERATDWWTYWFQEVAAAGEDYFAVGCGWE